MSAIFFKPWQGDHYASSPMFGKKVLVLGESHYQRDKNKPLDPEFTRDCIEEQLSGEWTHPFFTNVVMVFSDKRRRPTLEEKNKFGHSVAFYNYIQESVGSGPRVPPSAEMWQKSEKGFEEVT